MTDKIKIKDKDIGVDDIYEVTLQYEKGSITIIKCKTGFHVVRDGEMIARLYGMCDDAEMDQPEWFINLGDNRERCNIYHDQEERNIERVSSEIFDSIREQE